MRKIKSLFIASFFMFLGMTSFAQNKIDASNLTKEWTLLHSENGIEMYIQYGECTMGNVPEAFEYGMIKLVNSTATEKTIIYNIETYYTDGCVGCDKHEDEYSAVVIPANTTMIGDCENGLSVLLKNPLQTSFTEFISLQLSAIKVN